MLLQLLAGPSQLKMLEIKTKSMCFQLISGNLAMQLCPTHSRIALIILLSATQIDSLFMGLGGLSDSSRSAKTQQVSKSCSIGLGLPQAPGSDSADLLMPGIAAWTWSCSEQGHASARLSLQAQACRYLTMMRAALELRDGAL